MQAARYPCACCGYATMTEPTPGSFLVCPVCGWEDIGLDTERDRAALVRSRIGVFESGHAIGADAASLREPLPSEARPSGWDEARIASIRRDEAREQTQSSIEEAFADVRGEGRIDLVAAHDHTPRIDWTEAARDT